MSTTSDNSRTVFSSVFSALYAGITTAIRFPLIMSQYSRRIPGLPLWRSMLLFACSGNPQVILIRSYFPLAASGIGYGVILAGIASGSTSQTVRFR